MTVINSKRVASLILSAHEKRRFLIPKNTTYRLFHGEHDGIAGLEIEIYDKTALIRTHSLETDALLDTLVKTLPDSLNLDAILLKNHFEYRAGMKLALSDEILWGRLTAKNITIKEGEACYLYDSESPDFFPTANRPLRRWISALLASQNDPKLLSLGMESSNLIPKNQHPEFYYIETENQSFIDVTTAIRNITETTAGFNLVAIDAEFIRNVSKNHKALYPLFHNLFRRLDDRAFLAVKTRHLDELLMIWKNLARKSGVRLALIESAGLPADFPQCLGSLKMHRTNYALLDFTR